MKTRTKSVTAEDAAIGSRIRMRRIQLGVSQEKLGELLSVTFQQIQKYEKGTNRISGSRIVQVARALHVSPTWLLIGDEDASDMVVPTSDRYGVDALRMVSTLPSTHAKTAALHAIRAIAHALAPAPDSEALQS